MESLADKGEYVAIFRIITRIIIKVIVYDLLIASIVFLLLVSPDYSNLMGSTNILKLISTIGTIFSLSGFVVLILFSFTSQRTASTAIMTSQWGRSSKGPSNYSNEIISRQMRDWPTLMAGFIILFFGLMILGIFRT